MRRRPIYGAALLLFLCCLILPPSLWISDGIREGTGSFTGTVERREQREDMQVLYLKDTSIPKARIILVYLKNSDHSYKIGNILTIQGTIHTYKPPGNPGQFDSLTYYQTRKIDAFCFASRAELEEDKRDWLKEFLLGLRQRLSQGLERTLGERNGGILKAMLLGDKEQLPSEVKRLYQRSGIAHLLAISGLHVSILGAGLYRGLRKLGLPCAAAGLPVLALMAGYGILTGAGVSTLRALAMFFLSVGADLAGRTYDIRTALGAAAIWLLLEQPLYARDGAFLLSFGAVLGITEVTPVLKTLAGKGEVGEQEREKGGTKGETRKKQETAGGEAQEKRETAGGETRLPAPWERQLSALQNRGLRAVQSLPGILWEGLCTCLGIQIVTLPILLYCFYEVPIYSPLLNLLVIPLMAPLLTAGLCCMLLGVCLPKAAAPAVLLCRGILGITELSAGFFDSLPGAVFCGGRPEGWQIFLYYAGTALLLWQWKYGRERKSLIQGRGIPKQKPSLPTAREGMRFASVYLLCLLLLFWRQDPVFSLTMLDVGQGDSIYFQTRKGSTYLMDGGSTSEKSVGEYIVEPFFRRQGKNRVDYLLVSHMDRDHISGIQEILEEELLEVGCLILPAATQGSGVKAKGEPKGETEAEGRKGPEGVSRSENLCEALAEQDETYGELKRLAEERGVGIRLMGAGDVLEDGELRLCCLGPEKGEGYESRNAASLTISLEYKKLRILLTGDLEGSGESHVLGRLSGKAYDILKTAHHGSGNSTKEAWLACVSPTIALISCGENNSYGHPHEELLERLRNQGCRIYLTPQDGAVTVKSDGEAYQVIPYCLKLDVP